MCYRPLNNERAQSDGVRVMLDLLQSHRFEQTSLTPLAQCDPLCSGRSLREALSPTMAGIGFKLKHYRFGLQGLVSAIQNKQPKELS